MFSRSAARRRVGEAVAPGHADWRRFAAARFRPYQLLALCQGAVLVLVGLEVVIPFALAIGCPPALAALLGALTIAGGVAQLFVPRLLDRTDGDLRGLTLLVCSVGEMRGVLFCALALAVAAGVVVGALAVILLALLVAVTGVLTAVGGANLLAWHSAALSEPDRRLVVPRMMALSMAVGAALLFPVGLLLDRVAELYGVAAYAVPFAAAAAFGAVELVALRRLPHPGRVVVPKPTAGAAAPESPDLRQFVRASVFNGLGMGIAPYVSVYTIAILGLSAGFAMTLGALGMLTMVVVAAVAGTSLARGSSGAMLRRSFALRATAMALPLTALPGSPLAPVLLCLTVILASAGFATGQLAANERLFRLISGPAVIRHHGRYLARTSGAMAAAQLASSAVLAAGAPLGYLAFASLYAASSGLRVVAFRLARPPERRRDAPAPQALVSASGVPPA